MKYCHIDGICASAAVAPARGRGLKSVTLLIITGVLCRPRKGAWIEMKKPAPPRTWWNSRPRKGAWIEIIRIFSKTILKIVAPARGRGLKSRMPLLTSAECLSPPQGGVD